MQTSGKAKSVLLDMPVKTVFSIGALAFESDLPAAAFHLQLITDDIDNWKAKSEVVAIFHRNASARRAPRM